MFIHHVRRSWASNKILDPPTWGRSPSSFILDILPGHSGCRPWTVLQVYYTIQVRHKAVLMPILSLNLQHLKLRQSFQTKDTNIIIWTSNRGNPAGRHTLFHIYAIGTANFVEPYQQRIWRPKDHGEWCLQGRYENYQCLCRHLPSEQSNSCERRNWWRQGLAKILESSHQSTETVV